MAQISSISNGEALSSVRTKLNDVITNVNLLDPTGWVDYSATSTIVGWSSFTTKIIRYRIIGKQLFFSARLDGTSNSTSLTFTLPNNNINVTQTFFVYAANNGINVNSQAYVTAASNVVNALNGYTTWTASGTKTAILQGFLEIA